MQCCNQEMRDWSYYSHNHVYNQPEKVPHFYCSKCGAHHHKDKTYSKLEWFFYINEMTYDQWQENQKIAEQQRLMEESPHCHELINRRCSEGV